MCFVCCRGRLGRSRAVLPVLDGSSARDSPYRWVARADWVRVIVEFFINLFITTVVQLSNEISSLLVL